TGDPTHAVTFAYAYGSGTVIYSSIPLDYYRQFGGNNFGDVYAPNVLAYAATNPLGGLSVTGTTPANGSVVFTTPTQYVVNVSNPLVPGTVDAADFQVNGIAASAVAYTPGATSLTFTFASNPVAGQGLQTMHVAAGAFDRVSDGTGVREFNGSFRYDATLMQVTSTAPAGGSVVLPPFTTLDLNFNEPYNPATAAPSDFALNMGTVTAVTAVDADTLRLTLSGVTVEGTLTVGLPAGAMTDVFGNPGGAFSASYTLDFASSPVPTPSTAIPVAGSMIYSATQSVPTYIGFAGDADAYTLTVDPGQTITVVVAATDPALRPKVTLLLVGPAGDTVAGTATATAAGQPAVLQTAAVPGQLATYSPVALTYRIVVEGAGGTVGRYAVTTYLNAAVEAEGLGGGANNTRPTAQNINGSFVQLHSAGSSGTQPARGAVLGTVDSAPAAPPVAEAEPNDSQGTAQSLDGATFTVASDPFVTQSFTIPHITVLGTGDGTFDYYSFTAGAGDRGIFDIDFENFDSMLFLYGPSGNLLAVSDDNGGDPGSGSFFASYIDYTFAAAGTYTIAVAQFYSYDVGGGVDGTPIFLGQVYSLHVSLSGKPYAPPAPDVYAFAMSAGASATVVLTSLGSGPVGVTLQNAAGVTVASGAGLSHFVAPASGTYYAVVNGLPLTDYSLVVTRNAGFDTEGNNDIASAQSILSPQVAGRQWVLGNLELPSSNLVNNGSFETGDFTGWSVSTTGFPFVDWTVSGAGDGSGFFPGTSPQDGALVAWNGFDGGGPMEFSMFQDVAIPAGIPSATLSWQERIQWDFALTGSATEARTYQVLVQNPGTGATLGTLYSFSTGTAHVVGDTGWQTHTADLSAYAGTTVRLHFREVIPEAFTGPGQIEFDAIRLDFPRAGHDFYRVTVDGGQMLEVATATPGGGAGAFTNLLDPVIRVYNSAGVLVASNDNGAPDGRNAQLTYKVPKGAGGTYFIEVTSAASAAGFSSGEYVLSVKGNTAQYVGGATHARASVGAPLAAAQLGRQPAAGVLAPALYDHHAGRDPIRVALPPAPRFSGTPGAYLPPSAPVTPSLAVDDEFAFVIPVDIGVPVVSGGGGDRSKSDASAPTPATLSVVREARDPVGIAGSFDELMS
ncbi:MAG TPA: pre-peptidase C-terminal domain-containing protein, partial [Gemmataceae bacterium]|nr:pre-peptidase C-terminal domain-containing protein [Gemmataceae bacterium]